MDSLANNFLGLIYQFEIPKFSKKSYFPFNCKKKQSERHNVNNKKMQNKILNKSLLMYLYKKNAQKAQNEEY